jgi:hypothetical protein
VPYWHDDIGGSFGALMQDVDALLRTFGLASRSGLGIRR